MAELTILTPDGKSRLVTLQTDTISLGRSPANDLPFADDSGLSRRHLVLERTESGWTVSDAGSKNGTVVNGAPVNSAVLLQPGDRIAAGHLTLVFEASKAASLRPRHAETVVFVEGKHDVAATGAVSTNLANLLPDQPTTKLSAPVGASRIDALIRVGRDLAQLPPIDELFELILNLSIDAVGAERGVLLVLEGDLLVPRANRGEGFRISTGVRERVLKEKASILVNDVLQDIDFRGMQSLVMQHVRMFMAVPLQTNDKVIGLIYVDCPQLIREFSVEDLNLLTVMANVAAIRIEHARLAEIEKAERLMAKDLESAAIIQQGLLPREAPVVPGLDLSGVNLPSRSVGGDYYDFFPYGAGQIALALGDVSGKAMAAALLMTSLQARVQVLAESGGDPAHLISRLNHITAAHTPSNRFITFFFGVFDPQTGELCYCNAGQNPPLLMRSSGETEWLAAGGLVLGVLPNAPYESSRCILQPGDVLVLYSDGVTEAADSTDEEFGEDRLAHTVRFAFHQSAAEIQNAILEHVHRFCGSAPPADDVTLVVAKKM